MPWLAPVTMATRGGMLTVPDDTGPARGQELVSALR
jgi:hypothetical protein